VFFPRFAESVEIQAGHQAVRVANRGRFIAIHDKANSPLDRRVLQNATRRLERSAGVGKGLAKTNLEGPLSPKLPVLPCSWVRLALRDSHWSEGPDGIQHQLLRHPKVPNYFHKCLDLHFEFENPAHVRVPKVAGHETHSLKLVLPRRQKTGRVHRNGTTVFPAAERPVG